MPLLGWITFDDRTEDQHESHDAAVAGMPRFSIVARRAPAPQKLLLTDFWKHPTVTTTVGYPYPGILQNTGSCVGAGGGNCIFTLAAIEVARNGDAEEALVPFWLLTYGRSRYDAGMRGRGEGSLGSTFAQASREDGIIPATLAGLPKFTNAEDALSWGADAEMTWSDGAQISSQWLSESRQHLVGSTAPCQSSAEVRQAILNYYPCTDASPKFVNQPRMQGSQSPAAVGRLDSDGGHQTSILGWWNHPELGELFWYMNQWPRSMYPADPGGGPAGGCWITSLAMDWICRNGEVYAFSQFQGFPAQELSYLLG